MKSKMVYLLQHAPLNEEEDDFLYDEIKIIGIFSSKELAQQEIEKLVKLPGFINQSNAFIIGPYELNQDYWAEGFVKY